MAQNKKQVKHCKELHITNVNFFPSVVKNNALFTHFSTYLHILYFSALLHFCKLALLTGWAWGVVNSSAFISKLQRTNAGQVLLARGSDYYLLWMSAFLSDLDASFQTPLVCKIARTVQVSSSECSHKFHLCFHERLYVHQRKIV